MSIIVMDDTDDDVEEYWEACYASDWEDQLAERGYVVFDEEKNVLSAAEWVANLVEWRWEPAGRGYVPSRMWDAATPSRGAGRPTAVTLARLRDELDHPDDNDYDDIWVTDDDDDEWLVDETDEVVT